MGKNAKEQFITAPGLVGLAVLVVYGFWISAFIASGHDARDFIDIGQRFVSRSNVSAVIRNDPTYRYPADHSGYDGQFVYYIAVDPAHARSYLDRPAYRYGRILMPAMAGGLALGDPGRVPYTILLVSWLAVGLSTGVLAAWLKRHRISPWLALLYAFYVGTFIALRYDLTETLSFGLVVGAIYLFEFGGRWRLVLAGALFALAVLARETALFFVIAFALVDLVSTARRQAWQDGLRSTATFLAISLIPWMAWHAYLGIWLHDFGFAQRSVIQPAPFYALVQAWPWHVSALEEIVVVVIPALLCGWLALRALWRGSNDRYLVALLLQVMLLVVFVDPFAFPDLTASARYTIGIIIAALCAVPALDQVTGGRRTWLFACGAAWLLLVPWYLVKPLGA